VKKKKKKIKKKQKISNESGCIHPNSSLAKSDLKKKYY
jgi:hypothetical protein